MSYNKTERRVLSNGLKFSGWGFVLIIFSILFSHAGYRLDEMLNTAPICMIGLLFLAVILCIVRLIQQVSRTVKGGK